MTTQLKHERGFTLVEVIIAGVIMIILCIGTATVFTHAVKINSGNNLRSQAQSVLQAEVEYYRSLKFIPGDQSMTDLNTYRPADIQGDATATGKSISRPQRTSSDGTVFNFTVAVKNIQFSGGNDEAHVIYKEISVTATPVIAESSRPGWVSNANLRTNITFQRVRTN